MVMGEPTTLEVMSPRIEVVATTSDDGAAGEPQAEATRRRMARRRNRGPMALDDNENHYYISTVTETIVRHLEARGIRYTRARRAVVEALEAVDGPKSVAELGARLAVPQSSLYRTLAVLGEAGVVVAHHGPDGTARFELAEWIRGHHHHLVCGACGAVRDLVLTGEEETRLRELVTSTAERVGVGAEGHALEIVHRCEGCR